MNGFDLTGNKYADASLAGMTRGVLVNMVIYPLSTMMTVNQVNHPDLKTTQVGKQILQSSGYRGLYAGFSSQLARLAIKQATNWPMIMGLPPCFEQQGFTPTISHLATGATISFVDATVLAPLERSRVLAMLNQSKIRITIRSFFTDGWKGYGYNLSNGCVTWSTFMMTQNLLKKEYKVVTGREKLNLGDSCLLGPAISSVVALVKTPFDTLYNMKQADIQVGKLTLTRLFTGLKMNLVYLSIHNVATVWFMDLLSPQFQDENG